MARVRVLACAFLVAAALAGCGDEMAHQPKYKPLDQSAFFPDKRSARPLVAGTVARGHWRDDPLFYQALDGGKTSERLPFPLTRERLEQGRERFEIYCAVCHGATGRGDGMIVRRGFPVPPSYHEERLLKAKIGHFYLVITNGFGRMYPYADRVTPEERWEIAAYIRALQLSQNATLADVPPDARRRLMEER